MAVPTDVHAEITVPLELQIDLVRKVVHFERGFVERAGAQVKVLVIARVGHSGSERVADQLAEQLAHSAVAGKPVAPARLGYQSAAALRKLVVDQHVLLMFVAPGLEAEMPGIAAALGGQPVITVGTDGDMVDQGAILGFDLVSARPRISINLGQARKQQLDFNSDLFRLARVVK
jgi:hypothetical protein